MSTEPRTTIHPDYLAAILGVVAQAQALVRHSRQVQNCETIAEAAEAGHQLAHDVKDLGDEVDALAAWSADHIGGAR